ncbi:hypothetical protein Sjap_005310 [Stephania japonica]|uniref:Uncharacterized protein n=1 Tax=Stephania japonica TaxID=461633 RepID=A0AAP0K3V1_9MAGN
MSRGTPWSVYADDIDHDAQSRHSGYSHALSEVVEGKALRHLRRLRERTQKVTLYVKPQGSDPTAPPVNEKLRERFRVSEQYRVAIVQIGRRAARAREPS